MVNVRFFRTRYVSKKQGVYKVTSKLAVSKKKCHKKVQRWIKIDTASIIVTPASKFRSLSIYNYKSSRAIFLR